ncbi:translocation/assembly module TamB domain-containing protein [Aquirhabdus parva]|uniref:Translocation and assembly module TamB C-terminal domain-containing protein n=1 Tax=Aquirhabdus parva TaxID=2283318 RepID=A0A345P5Y6_9GAMM|nr:translocation/assembly module TamB domain-containing protein [Aquirhabdus parva]AXI02695.1 hypothetical protein HYN46_07530 [Aquirhabdus parva]
MTAPEQSTTQPTLPKKKTLRRVLVGVFSLIFGLLALLVIGLFALAGSDSGTKFLLDKAGTLQHLVTYHYVGGNLQNGVTLDQFRVNLEKTDITAKKIVARIGWRSVLAGEVHLSHAVIDDLVIHSKTLSNGKPFTYTPIKLPVVLRVNEGIINGLTISQVVLDPVSHQLEPRVDIVFTQVHLREARWKEDLLTLKDSSIKSAEFEADQVTGDMEFNRHYPIKLTGRLAIPLLHKEGFPPFQVNVTGDLEEIHAGLVAQTKDVMGGNLIVRPMDHILSLKGKLNWNDFHWPIVTDQNFYSKTGQAEISSLPHGIDIHIVTDFMGSSVPAGQYDVKLFTDYKGLDIQSLNAKIAQGTATGFGRLDWQGDLRWFIQGQFTGVKVANLLPENIKPYSTYLPETLTGPFRHTALMGKHHTQLGVRLISSVGEQWIVGVGRAGSMGNNSLPLAVDARWQNLSRTLAGAGQINTGSGTAKIGMHQGLTTINTTIEMLPSQHVPSGHYAATIISQPTGVKIPILTFKGDAGSLGAAANISFATKAEKKKAAKPMTWAASVATKGLDLTSIVSSPIQRLQGAITASGISTQAQQTISVQPELTGILQSESVQKGASTPSRNISLTGKGQAILLMNTAKNTSGLKSYSAKFDGDLKGSEAPTGNLNIQVSGTPDLTRIERFEHNGAAGQISATGQIMTKAGLQWQATGRLNNFNLGFFVPTYPSALSGAFNTTGQWDALVRNVQISQLDLAGSLKKQPLLAKGSLSAIFNPKAVSPLPERLIANNFMVDWAGNRVTANGGASASGTGAPVGNFLMNIDARNLGQISPNLNGRVYGTVSLSGQSQSPDAHINLSVEQLKMPELTIKNATLIGDIPQLGLQPSQLTLNVNDLRRGKQVINNVNAKLTGTQKSHALDMAIKTPKTQFSVQLAGGLNEQMDWIGQIRQGALSTKQLTLKQEQAAALQYLHQTQAVTLAAHCWSGAGKLCITEPLIASAQAGHVAIALDALDLAGFNDVMPSGMVWTGKLQGHATASWQANTSPQINAQISTDNGFIGLAADDPQDPPSTMPYQRLSLLLATESDGIKLRFDAKTPSIGTGYVDALIDPKPETKTINGALVLDDVQLQVLKPFLPGIRDLSGVASLAGGMSGPLTNPAFYGEFKLNNGRIVATNLPLNLHDINFSSSIRGTQASINGQFMSGDGKGTLTGLATWVDKPEINLKLVAKELEIRQPPMVAVWVSPSIDVQVLPIDKQVTINGRIDVPRGSITPGASTGSNAISKSADVRVVRLDQNVDTVLQNVKAWTINADIDAALGDAVYFRGFGSNAKLLGQLHIRQRGQGGMTAVGQIALQRNARVEAYGQALTLSKSNVIFSGPMLQPQLDIEAFKIIDSHTVGLRITGRASNPKITTFNDAGLTDQETYSAILSGHINSTSSTINNTAGFRSDVNNAIAAAGISAGLSGSRGFTNKLGSAFGLSNLTFDAEGSGDGTTVNVTGYISPDLYLRYGVGVFTPINKLTLRYQMTQRLYMEASSSLDRAIDFFYNWRF